ncbi:Olfactory receptor 8H3 [Heterocephalus glaber]|uniref:Olfactory receptor n=1 Tax=Heterocephalus glaber TaxID=10181 RepID=G5BG46_HETGA|nr:Olfactory receptor 8H3 [Heterocephalus glaber]
MGRRNSTSVADFILMGLTDSAEAKLVLSGLFLLIYLVTVLGNAGMILIIPLDPQLHTPMYFFLTHLSFLDLSYSSVFTPKTLQSLLTSTKSISFLGCFTQLYFFAVFGAAECLLLSSMAYDRYVAICNPLHYLVIMSTRLCRGLVAGCYAIGFLDATVSVCFMSRLHFCKSNVIQHFFCDASPILALSCSDTSKIEIIIFIFAGFNLGLSLSTISGSYLSILSTILKINSTAGKKKAFSTCASHLLGVTIFYSTMMFTYLKPKTSYSLGRDQVASVFYTIACCMAICSPLLYTIIMSPRVCWVLMATPHVYNTFVSLLVHKDFYLALCSHNVISDLYCDGLLLLSLLSPNTHEIEMVILILSVSNLISSLLVILVSYLLILIAVLRMNSAESRRKAFST